MHTTVEVLVASDISDHGLREANVGRIVARNDRFGFQRRNRRSQLWGGAVNLLHGI